MAEPAPAAIPTIRAIPKSKPAGLAAAARGTTAAAPTTARSPGSLSWPVHGQIRRAYGEQPSGARNDGLDIAAPEGSPVVAVEDGIVTYAGSDLPGYGNMLLIRHPDGCTSVYAHNEALLVGVGTKVARGQAIARVGRTGEVQEAQLHFQLRIGNRPVDPQPLLEPAVTVVASLTPSTLAALGAR
jgi:septal ring factor EnvC (AmiA/AmiB activator)